MTSFNVMAGGRSQVLVDEQQLQQLQSELKRRGEELERLRSGMETLSAVNTPAQFVAAAMALCNEMASRWHAERVGIGFLKGRYVRLKALSHTEKITRHMQLVQDIESSMEECLDQDVEVLFPPPKEASFVYRNTETLAQRHGPNVVICLPLRRESRHLKERNDERFGNVVAVLSMERKSDKPFTLSEIEALRLTCDLFTARLVDLYENDRWAGAKALRSTRRGLAWALGAKHTWAKAAAVAVCAAVAYSLLANLMFHVEAPFETQAIQEQVVNAPFEGQLKTVEADVNDLVFTPETAEAFDRLNQISTIVPVLPVHHPKTVLATLDVVQYQAQYDSKVAEARQYELQAQQKGSEVPPKTAEAQELQEKAAQSRHEAEFYHWFIEHSVITAPINGRVFKGDLKSKMTAHVSAGEELFEIGQMELRAELSVSEDQISEVQIGQTGTLKATAYPDRPVHFTVERINPIAETKEGKNIFKVRVQLDPKDTSWLRQSGVEGLAKIDVRPEKAAWIWTYRMVNWVRMKLWMYGLSH